MKLIITTAKLRRAREKQIISQAIEMSSGAISEVVKSYSEHWQEEHLKTAKDRKVIADFTSELSVIIESATVETA